MFVKIYRKHLPILMKSFGIISYIFLFAFKITDLRCSIDLLSLLSFYFLYCLFRGENKIWDASGREIKSFPDITPLLQRLHSEGYKLGIASE